MKHLQYSESISQGRSRGGQWQLVELGKYSLFLEGCWLVASCEVFANKLPLRGPKLALATPIDNIS